jgi:hypothetical protein
VEEYGDPGLPEFPEAPEGLVRMEHPATVEACIRYWEAVRVQASRTSDPALERTARALRLSFEEARQGLKKEEQPPNLNPASHARRGRLRS